MSSNLWIIFPLLPVFLHDQFLCEFSKIIIVLDITQHVIKLRRAHLNIAINFLLDVNRVKNTLRHWWEKHINSDLRKKKKKDYSCVSRSINKVSIIRVQDYLFFFLERGRKRWNIHVRFVRFFFFSLSTNRPPISLDFAWWKKKKKKKKSVDRHLALGIHRDKRRKLSWPRWWELEDNNAYGYSRRRRANDVLPKGSG